jgi:hypothetical protein
MTATMAHCVPSDSSCPPSGSPQHLRPRSATVAATAVSSSSPARSSSGGGADRRASIESPRPTPSPDSSLRSGMLARTTTSGEPVGRAGEPGEMLL